MSANRTNTQVLFGAINEAQGTTIPSVAGTTDIGAATGNYVVVSGVNTITGLGTIQAGTRRIVTFSGILILTHNAVSLILPTGANITTAVNDTAEFISLGGGNWICTNYERANGRSLAAVFTALTDTPGNYTSAATKLVAVNAAGNALIYPLVFVDQTTGAMDIGGTAAPTTTFLKLPACTTNRSNLNLERGSAKSSLSSGDLWNDDTYKMLGFQPANTPMLIGGTMWRNDTTKTIANTVTETTLLSTGLGTKDVGANELVAGKSIVVFLAGFIADTGTPTGTIRFFIDGVSVWTSGAVTMGTITGTGRFKLAIELQCHSVGVGGTGYVDGDFAYWASTSSQRTIADDNAAATTIDTTQALSLDVKWTWGTASASNTLTVTKGWIELK